MAAIQESTGSAKNFSKVIRIDEEAVKEHLGELVRGSDGILRSWCQRARTEVPAGQFPA